MSLPPFETTSIEDEAPLEQSVLVDDLSDSQQVAVSETVRTTLRGSRLKELRALLGECFSLDALVRVLNVDEEIAAPVVEQLLSLGALSLLPDRRLRVNVGWAPIGPFSLERAR